MNLVTKFYVALLKSLLVLAGLGYLSEWNINHAARTAAHDLRTGLISLTALNRKLGM